MLIPYENRKDSDYELISMIEVHHLNNERENQHLYDENVLVPCYRGYHTMYHSYSVEQLIKEPWYASFLERLKNKNKDIYLKEMRKHLKANLITIEEYDKL